MINLFFDYLLRPIILVIAAMSLFNSIMEKRKSVMIISSVVLILAVVIISIVYDKLYEKMFIQIYLFLFFLSIGLVILALRKQEDTFTVIGIGLMVAMLVILLKFSLV
ncbi:hypothetical protein [uncultured Anaerococcus sp.]|uniref:hypothetical protein n=1 Tax=uncultured Anaerococcus sp. TaxID=293428 RepID=UPI002889FF1F|nr:hypothetical protein [uncultured Anaerococcus sp.]